MSREAFEAWALRNTSLPSAHEMAWAAWQAALAQPQTQPVAWASMRQDGTVYSCAPLKYDHFDTPLYATPQQAQPDLALEPYFQTLARELDSQVDPAAQAQLAPAPAGIEWEYYDMEGIGRVRRRKDGAAPAQPAEPLTDEQIDAISLREGGVTYRQLARAVEAHHGIAASGSADHG